MALTEEQIESLTVGPETDYLVAQYIGWRLSRPSIDLTTAFQVEEYIDYLGLSKEYVKELRDIVKGEEVDGDKINWLLAHATSLQRCKAYLMLYVE